MNSKDYKDWDTVFENINKHVKYENVKLEFRINVRIFIYIYKSEITQITVDNLMCIVIFSYMMII